MKLYYKPQGSSHRGRARILAIGCVILFALCASTTSAQQLTAQQALQLFQLQKTNILKALQAQTAFTADPVRQPFQSPPTRDSAGGMLETTANIRYGTNQIWSEGTTKTLVHRSYEGKLVGNTWRLRPGDVLRVNWTNNLPIPPGGAGHEHGNENDPNRYNTSNLHTHGLHVSPAGNSDNVIVEIDPGGAWFMNEIYIPRDHPAGTFWYHPHVHGSTAVQVSSAMAGALIIEGGVDNVPAIAAAKDEVFVFQQIPYLPTSTNTNVVAIENMTNINVWSQNVADGVWRTTINGQTLPVITINEGEVQRWRLIHAGVTASIKVQLEGQSLYEIAVDGLTYGYMTTNDSIMLQPGYRSDVLVKPVLPPGNEPQVTTFLIDGSTTPSESLYSETGEGEAADVMAIVIIKRSNQNMPLPTDAELAPYRPHKNITTSELTGVPQSVLLAKTNGQFAVDGVPYDASNPPRTLTLGKAAEWTLSSVGNHPFHIHVNPFEIVATNGVQISPTIWRDTLLLQSGITNTVRTRYEDYIGKFVLHCHILTHEDQGMMQMVEVVAPGSASGRNVAAVGPIDRKNFLLADADDPAVVLCILGVACSHCNDQLAKFVELADDFAASGVRIVCVSSDAKDAALNQGKLPFPLIADADLKRFNELGCLNNGTPLHGVFVIDEAGEVAWSRIGSQPFMDAAAVLRRGEQLVTAPSCP